MPIHSSFLKYFDEVCKCGSIRKAANNLHIASSAVNRQILKIEDELGVKLFERSHEGIRLTEAGNLLSQHVSRTLNDADRTLKEIANCYDKAPNSIIAAGQESVIARILPPVFLELYAEFPSASTSFIAAGGTDLDKMIQNGRADIALMFDATEGPDVELRGQVTLPVGAIMSPDHPLAKHTSLTIHECSEYVLILPDESWMLRERLNKEIARAKVEIGTMTTSNSIEFLRATLGKKSSIGFKTTVGLESSLEDGSLVHIPLIGANGSMMTQTFSIGLNKNRQTSALLDRAVELLEARIKAYNPNN
ncbi:LysR family transcriptional regulator [Leucothrix sargassi]|nr:LysR family transcriptional regulator [Leucothrix sargassi]